MALAKVRNLFAEELVRTRALNRQAHEQLERARHVVAACRNTRHAIVLRRALARLLAHGKS